MRCPQCKGKLKFVLKLECAETTTFPTTQIVDVKPSSHLHEFVERLEKLPKTKPKPKRTRRRKAVEPIVKPIKPPRLLKIKSAAIKLFYCKNCRIFLKVVK